jgi:hypothetical protein
MTPTAHRKLFLALCGNAVLLGLILLSMWTRGAATPALAQGLPSASAGGITVVPAQFSQQTFGCYLLDADRQTLCVYTFHPLEHDLHMEAARDVQYDRLMKFYNTSPPPTEMQRLAERAAEPPRTVTPPPPPQ